MRRPADHGTEQTVYPFDPAGSDIELDSDRPAARLRLRPPDAAAEHRDTSGGRWARVRPPALLSAVLTFVSRG